MTSRSSARRGQLVELGAAVAAELERLGRELGRGCRDLELRLLDHLRGGGRLAFPGTVTASAPRRQSGGERHRWPWHRHLVGVPRRLGRRWRAPPDWPSWAAPAAARRQTRRRRA